jgi:hypothetical protein
MGTTATIALIGGAKIYLGHAGDSRAYLLANGALRQLTKDHSWVQEQVEQGTMTAEQAAVDPRKNQITRALGVSSLIKVDRVIEDLRQGDALVLCTDGLSNMVNDAEIQHYAQTISEPQQACQALVNLANQRGGGDNITVVIARALGDGAKGPVVAPAAQVTAEPADEMITRRIVRPPARGKRAKMPTAKVAEPAAKDQMIPPAAPPEPLAAAAATSRTEFHRVRTWVGRGLRVVGLLFFLCVYVGAAAVINTFVAFAIGDDPVFRISVVGATTTVILAFSIFLSAMFFSRDKRA